MPNANTPQEHMSQRPRRDVELCKVVFTAALSQILYARRALSPGCFQLVPINSLLSGTIDDILSHGPGVQSHDLGALRDSGKTVFLRQAQDYELSRFLGIMNNDIFPLLDSECLVKFRINFLRTKAWTRHSLVESYAIRVRYGDDGAYELDVWRSGTGKYYVSTTNEPLWNLGDFLSRLPILTVSLHWTLGFDTAERPDDLCPLGVWKFNLTDCEDANLSLKQKADYDHTRIAHLRILPLSPTKHDPVTSGATPESDPPAAVNQKSQTQLAASHSTNRSLKRANSDTHQDAKHQSRSMRKARPNSDASEHDNTPGDSGTGDLNDHVGVKRAKPSPPQTLTSQPPPKKSPAKTAEDEGPQNPLPKKKAATKRKPKKPLQLFETAASSLPPTQVLGESQSMRKTTQQVLTYDNQDDRILTQAPRSIISETLSQSILDGIDLSSDGNDVTDDAPSVDLPTIPSDLGEEDQPSQWPPNGDSRTLLRIAPTSSVRGTPGLSQWEPRASPAQNLLRINEDEGEENEQEAGSVSLGEKDISYEFEPGLVEQKEGGLFAGLDGDTENEE
ncbi:hypothetical protein VTJ04DRAFT_10370 [Mycothermus thermophilus]|uniref:uncharacterized protein n=1 Tax=Humicola insolens TaxID=85995 RepID=UPI003744A07F